jgi:hypothetical protein
MGSVLTFELYKPLQVGDSEKIAALVDLFKKVYTYIIAAVLTIGLLIIPLLSFIVKSTLDYQNLIVYYILYLLNSVASYFVIYRTMVIDADQKRYITQLVEISSRFVMYIVQCVYLVITKDFLGYLCIQLLFTILNNIVLNEIAKKCIRFCGVRKEVR